MTQTEIQIAVEQIDVFKTNSTTDSRFRLHAVRPKAHRVELHSLRLMVQQRHSFQTLQSSTQRAKTVPRLLHPDT